MELKIPARAQNIITYNTLISNTATAINDKAIKMYENKPLGHFLYIVTSAFISNAKTPARMPKNAYFTAFSSENRSSINDIARIITNDGSLSHYLLSPKRHVSKIYHVKTQYSVTKSDIENDKRRFNLENTFVAENKMSIIGDISEQTIILRLFFSKHFLILNHTISPSSLFEFITTTLS